LGEWWNVQYSMLNDMTCGGQGLSRETKRALSDTCAKHIPFTPLLKETSRLLGRIGWEFMLLIC